MLAKTYQNAFTYETTQRVPKAPHHSRCDLRVRIRGKSCQPKVRNLAITQTHTMRSIYSFLHLLGSSVLAENNIYLRLEIIIEKDVRRLDVAVDYSWMAWP